MSSPYFLERHPKSPISIEFHERIFRFVDIPLKGEVHGEYLDTGLRTNLWLDSGKSRLLTPDNTPILSGAGPQLQLTPNNSAEIKLLYEECLILNLLEPVADNSFKITIVPLRKITNDESIRNRWTVFRPDLIPAIGPLIGSKLMSNLRRAG